MVDLWTYMTYGPSPTASKSARGLGLGASGGRGSWAGPGTFACAGLLGVPPGLLPLPATTQQQDLH